MPIEKMYYDAYPDRQFKTLSTLDYVNTPTTAHVYKLNKCQSY